MRFSEWLEKRHPEILDESMLRNAALGLAAAGALWAGSRAISSAPHNPTPGTRNVSSDEADDWGDDEDDDDGMRRQQKHARDLLAAAKRAGVPKSEWNRLKGHKTGGVVVVVNGRRVPLTRAEQERVRQAEEMLRRMGN